MIAAELRDQITVYSEIRTKDEANQVIRTYTKAFDDRAAITFMSGDKKLELGAALFEKIYKFKVRFALGRYNETMVISWRGDYYTINSIDPDNRRTYLIITGTRAMPGTIKVNSAT